MMYKNSITNKVLHSLFKTYHSALAASYTIRLFTSLGKKIKIYWLSSFISLKLSFFSSEEARKNSVIFNIALRAIHFTAEKILFIIEAFSRKGFENSKLVTSLASKRATSVLKVNPFKGSIAYSLVSKFWMTED